MPDPIVHGQNLCNSESHLIRGAVKILENSCRQKWPDFGILGSRIRREFPRLCTHSSIFWVLHTF